MITTANMNDIISGITLTKIVSISPDTESKKEGVKKTITLKMKYDGLTLADIFQKALKDDVISWANGGGGRKNYDNLTDKQVVEVSAKSPGSGPQEDPETAMVARLRSMTPEQQLAYLKELTTKAATK